MRAKFIRGQDPKTAMSIGRYSNDDREVYPSWLSKNDMLTFVDHVDDLVVGEHYFILDLGMNSWHGDYEYQGYVLGKYYFEDHADFNEISYTSAEMWDAIRDEEIRNQL